MQLAFPEFEPDQPCRFERDVLFLDIWPLAAPVRIHPWKSGLEVEQHLRSGWRRASRTADLLLTIDVDAPADSAVGRFVASIPARARRHARRCGAHALAALRLLASHPRARAHARIPNLLWFLAAYADTRGLDVALAALEGTPSAALAACTQGRAVPGALGLLARVATCADDRSELPWLLDALGSRAAVRLLRHTRTIHTAHLRAALGLSPRHRGAFYRRLFAEGPSEEEVHEAADLALRTASLGRRAGVGGAAAQVDQSRPAALKGLRTRWSLRAFRRHGVPDRETPKFPDSPIAGTDAILPITHSAMLQEEGAQMGHCIADYEDVILARRFAAYRLVAPERATLLLDVDDLAILELRGVGNADVGEETRRAIEAWIADASAARR
jgi:hypothetical protein